MENNTVNLGAFIAHLDTLDYSDKTKVSYIDAIKDYLKRGFSTISTEEEWAYRNTLVAEGKKGSTINTRLHGLNAYNRWLGLPNIKEIRINEDPFQPNGMEVSDYQRLILNLLEDGKYEWYVTIKLLASTGMRISEALMVTFGDLRKGVCTIYGKGRKPRTVFFSPNLKETLFFYIKDKADGEKVIPFRQSSIRSALARFKRRYSLSCLSSPHEFRRYFARQMYDATHDASLIKGLLGHADLKTTSKYIKKTQKQALETYSRVQNW